MLGLYSALSRGRSDSFEMATDERERVKHGS